MTRAAPIIVWFRRDLRLRDHPALRAAANAGVPVIPVFIRDPEVDALGAAARFRLGLSVAALQGELARIGSRLILRAGPADLALDALIAETGARQVVWTRAYDPAAIARDTAIKAALTLRGIEATSFAGRLLFEPWSVATGQGGPYRVFTPYWRAVRGRDVGAVLTTPARLDAPKVWPASAALADWQLGAAMGRGAAVVGRHLSPGETAALARLDAFAQNGLDGYEAGRNFPGEPATSGLSEYLAYGEISPRRIWHAGWHGVEAGIAGAEAFLRQLVWREYAYHLMFHTPVLLSGNWRPEWDGFGWRRDGEAPEVLAWKRGRTGVPMVDAAMREMYVTGRMHNRARMIAASFLTKHLLTDWRIGCDWFAAHLTDWDPAANAMGWQWVAGSGPDAAPYFRVFNPVSQAEKFDPHARYRRRWIAESYDAPSPTALSYFDAVPRAWQMSPSDAYPAPVIGLAAGRARALAAYAARKAG